MASISRPTRLTEARSGGKIVRPRRTFAAKTPYDRPGLSPNSNPQNPNWLSRYIYSPTRLIATGAGKIISSVFNTDSSPSSSSGDDSDDDSDDIDISPHAADTTKKDGTVQVIQHQSELQPIVQKSETKHLIERLIMQVTFSREEFDRLTNIIKSRVVDGPIIGDAADGGLSEPSRTVGNDADMPDLCIAAVMEAKKWLEEKKLGSNSKSELELGTCTLNSAMLPHCTDGEAGSPVDMAKSYMRTRPPWASPSVNRTEYRSPSPIGMQLFKDGTPYSIGFSSFSSKMKRDSPASGSWNITEEIRKVRSKATEEMLRSPSKVDWSLLALENKNTYNYLVANEVEASMRDKLPSFTKSIDASLNLATRATTSCGFPVSQATQDGLQREAPSPNPATLNFEQNQLTMKDLEDIRTMEENREVRLSSGQRLPPAEELQSDVDGLKDTNGTSELFNNKMDETLQDPGLNDQNCSMSKETIRTGGSFAANGFPPSVSSLSPGEDIQQNSWLSDEKQNMVGSGHDEVSPSVPTGETCALLNEASVEVPIMCESDGVATGSENSSSLRDEGLLRQATPKSKRRVTGKTSGATEKQHGKKISRYNRRGRGRGK